MENPGRKISEPLSGFSLLEGTEMDEEGRAEMRATIKVLVWVLAIVAVGHVILTEVIR